MVRIDLTREQMQKLQPEINKCKKAYWNKKRGILFFQVWPDQRIAEGCFIPHDPSKKITEIAREYHL